MNLHDHDHDLIMALAAGALDAPAAAEARRTISGCAECSEDLTLQERALAAFAAAPAVRLTEMEAARLERDLDTALGHERTVVVPAPQRQRRFNWVPIFSVAAVFLALVLVAPSLTLLGGGSDDSGSDVVAFDTAESDVANGEADATLQATAEAEAPQLSRATDDLAAEESAGDEAASAATTTQPTALADDEDAADAGLPSVGELLATLSEVIDPGDEPDDARLKATAEGLAPPPLDDLDRCLIEGAVALNVSGETSYVLGDVALGEDDVRFTAHPIRTVLRLAAHDGATCEVIAFAGR